MEGRREGRSVCDSERKREERERWGEQLKSIMNKRVPVSRVAPGQSATFALKRLKKAQLRKGMILAGAALQVPAAVCVCARARVCIILAGATFQVH